MDRKYVDTVNSLCNYEVRLQPNVYNGQFPAKFTNNTVYQTYLPLTVPFGNQSLGNTAYQNVTNSCNLFGYTNLTSPLFSKGVN